MRVWRRLAGPGPSWWPRPGCGLWPRPSAPEPESNLVRCVLLRPEAQRSLVRWRDDWAAPLLGIVWSTYRVNRTDPDLTALVMAIVASATTHALRQEFESRGARLHQDVDRRRVRHPVRGETEVHVMVSTPESLRPHGVRLMGLVYADLLDQVPQWQAQSAAMRHAEKLGPTGAPEA